MARNTSSWPRSLAATWARAFCPWDPWRASSGLISFDERALKSVLPTSFSSACPLQFQLWHCRYSFWCWDGRFLKSRVRGLSWRIRLCAVLELIRVTEIRHESRRNRIAVLKVLFLLAVTAVAFTVPAFCWTQAARWFVVPALMAIQIIALLICRMKPGEIAYPIWRLKWLFLFLIAAYALLPAEAPSDARVAWPLPGVEWRLSINLTGLDHAGLMCLQIIAVILASALVRLTGTGRDLVDGLQSFRLPPLFVYSLDHTLALLAGGRRPGSGGGAGRRNRSAQGGFLAVFKRVLRGDIGFFVESIRGNMRDAAEQADRKADRHFSAELAHDVAVVTGIALAMASLKLVKLLPGVPFAPGHKVLFLFPLYVLAARLTHSRWGGTVAGSIMGVIAFLQGDGRFSVLEILKNVTPGLVIDLADPFVRRLPAWALGYSILGLAAAVARTTTEYPNAQAGS